MYNIQNTLYFDGCLADTVVEVIILWMLYYSIFLDDHRHIRIWIVLYNIMMLLVVYLRQYFTHTLFCSSILFHRLVLVTLICNGISNSNTSDKCSAVVVYSNSIKLHKMKSMSTPKLELITALEKTSFGINVMSFNCMCNVMYNKCIITVMSWVFTEVCLLELLRCS